jgi:hypothetical protein
MEERPFRSVSLSTELLTEIETFIDNKNAEGNAALLPPEFKSVAAFVAEAARLRLKELKKTVS